MALAFLRRHRWWFNWFLVVIIASFIYFYIPAFHGSDTGTPGETLATVGGLPISVAEFQRVYAAQRQRMEQIYQGRLDASMLKQMGLEDQVLEGLVSDRVVLLEAKRLGVGADDASVADAISKIPGLQENGHFVGAAEYRRRLESQGRSVEEFEAAVRSSLLQQRLEALVTDGVAVAPAEAELDFRRKSEQIRAEYVLVDSARFKPQANVSDAEVAAWFASKQDAYKLPERRILSYLLLDQVALEGRVTVTDHDLDVHYQEHREEFKQEEQACASHILVKLKSAASQEGHDDAEARKLAEAILAKLKAGGDFAELARKSSEDKGSAASGGDLGCFGRGRMVPEFENAVFSMGAGETSDLVKSSFGYHIIRLVSHQPESTLPLAAVKEQIRRSLVQERVQALMEERAQATAALLRRGRSLEEAAKEQGVALQKSAPFARGEADKAGVLGAPALLARAFELKPGEVDKAGFRVARGRAFIALVEAQPARAAELKDVSDKIKADIGVEKASESARALASDLKAKAEKTGLDKAALAAGLVRKETPGLVSRGQPLGDLGSGAALEEVAYALPEKTLSNPVRTSAGCAILRIIEKKPFDPVAFEKQKDSLVASLRDSRRRDLFQAYMSQARQRFQIERNSEAFRRVASR
jgi:peptidyl-prolyl cis-trans isomerase D